MRFLLSAFALFAMLSAPSMAQEAPRVVMETSKGKIVMQMRPDLAPNHVERIVTLAEEGFYNDVPFHRVIAGFMAQTGDPTGTGMGGSEYDDLQAEFTRTPFERGVVGMARTQNPNSGNSQFFIMFARAPHLDGQYTVFAQVVEGMDVVDRLNRGNPAAGGTVDNPDRIIQMRVE